MVVKASITSKLRFSATRVYLETFLVNYFNFFLSIKYDWRGHEWNFTSVIYDWRGTMRCSQCTILSYKVIIRLINLETSIVYCRWFSIHWFLVQRFSSILWSHKIPRKKGSHINLSKDKNLYFLLSLSKFIIIRLLSILFQLKVM